MKIFSFFILTLGLSAAAMADQPIKVSGSVNKVLFMDYIPIYEIKPTAVGHPFIISQQQGIQLAQQCPHGNYTIVPRENDKGFTVLSWDSCTN